MRTGVLLSVEGDALELNSEGLLGGLLAGHVKIKSSFHTFNSDEVDNVHAVSLTLCPNSPRAAMGAIGEVGEFNGRLEVGARILAVGEL